MNQYIQFIQTITHLLSCEENTFGIAYEDILLKLYDALNIVDERRELVELMQEQGQLLLFTKKKHLELLERLIIYLVDMDELILPEDYDQDIELIRNLEQEFINPYFRYLDNNTLFVASPWFTYAHNLKALNNKEFEHLFTSDYWHRRNYNPSDYSVFETIHHIDYLPSVGSSYEFAAIIENTNDNLLKCKFISFDESVTFVPHTLKVTTPPVIKTLPPDTPDAIATMLLQYPGN